MCSHILLCLHQVVRAIRQSHADLPIFALSQTADNAASAIKGDLYGGAVQDWMKLPADASEVIARVEGALRHQVPSHFFVCVAQVFLGCQFFISDTLTTCCMQHAQTGYAAVLVQHVADDVACIRRFDCCLVCVQYQVIKKLRNEVLALKGDIDTLQRLQQENHQPERLVSQQSM